MIRCLDTNIVAIEAMFDEDADPESKKKDCPLEEERTPLDRLLLLTAKLGHNVEYL